MRNLSGKALSPSDEEYESLLKLIEEARIFVFLNEENTQIDSRDINPSEFGLPFPVCFFESVNKQGKPLVTGYEVELIGNPMTLLVSGVLAQEVSPNYYNVFFLSRPDFITHPSLIDLKANILFSSGTEAGYHLRQFFMFLKNARLGGEKIREKIKIGAGKNKKQIEIRQVIRVSSKKSPSAIAPLFSQEIDWSHRWEVRGHWREHQGLGKNRSGDYCVSGFTWVKEHEKGPEEKPLIKKVRIIDAKT